MEIHDMRKEYSERGLRMSDLYKNPFQQFQKWFDEAVHAGLEEVNAFALSTVRPDNFPCTRTLLLKAFDSREFVFYTNYKSRKAEDIEKNPNVSLLFLWLPLNRQVQILGRAKKLSREASERYFQTRPRESQVGAWASPQSEAIPNREFLDNRFVEFAEKFKGQPVPLPEHWGGYSVAPVSFEFWQGRNQRLHDRFLYRLKDGIEEDHPEPVSGASDRFHYLMDKEKNWIIERLAP